MNLWGNIFQVVSSEFILVQHHHLHHPEWRNLSQKHGLTKTWSSPYLYNPQVRVPPIHHHHTGTESDEPVAKVLYPTEAHFPHVPLDVPVKLVILGSPQVGKSALALRYLTKNQSKFFFVQWCTFFRVKSGCTLCAKFLARCQNLSISASRQTMTYILL